VRGEPNKVSEAVKMLRDAVSSAREVKINITAAVSNYFFRKSKNDNLRALELETGAFISLDTEMSPTGVRAVIFGTNLAVAAAEAKLYSLGTSIAEVSIPIPSASVIGDLLGKNGANIKVLQAETGAVIDIVRELNVVQISGAKESVAAAKARVDTLFDHHSSTSATLNVDPKLISLIIGRGGANLRAIQEETKAEIHVDDHGEIRIKGSTPEALNAAMKKLREKAHLDSPAVEVIHMNEAVIGRVIGRKGANMQKIEKEFKVSVSVDTASCCLTLRGEVDAVSRAHASLSKQINDLHEGSLTVPSSALRTIFGRPRGSRLRATEAETRAHIDVPRESRTDETAPDAMVTINVRGSVASVALTVAALQAQINFRSYCVLWRPRAAVATTDAASLTSAISKAFASDSVPKNDLPVITVHDANEIFESDVSPMSAIFCESASASLVDRAVHVIDSALSSTRKPADFSFLLLDRVSCAVTELLSSEIDSLVKSAGAGGAAVACDLLGKNAHVAIWGPPANVTAASTAVTRIAATLEERCAIETLPRWVLASFRGKEGESIATLEKACGEGVRLSLNPEASVVRIVAKDAGSLTTARDKVRGTISSMLRSHLLFQIPSSSVPAVIGKGGASIKALQSETGAAISLDRDTHVLSVSAATAEAAEAVKQRLVELCGDAELIELTNEAADALTRVFSFSDLKLESAKALAGLEPLLSVVESGLQGVRLSLSRDSAVLLVKSVNADNVDRAAKSLPAALERARKLHPPTIENPRVPAAPYMTTYSSTAPSATVSSSVQDAAQGSIAPAPAKNPWLILGGIEEKPKEKLTKNMRKRLNKKARAVGEVDGEDDEVAAQPVQAPIGRAAVTAAVIAPPMANMPAASLRAPLPTAATGAPRPLPVASPIRITATSTPVDASSIFKMAPAASLPPVQTPAVVSLDELLPKLGLSSSTMNFIRSPAVAASSSGHAVAAATTVQSPPLISAAISSARINEVISRPAGKVAAPPPPAPAASVAPPAGRVVWGALRNNQVFGVAAGASQK
jgi:transcription antitermination factor NusA-like protein